MQSFYKSVARFLAGPLFGGTEEVGDTALQYALLTFLEKKIDERKKRLRNQLLTLAESRGKPTKTGFSAALDGAKVTRSDSTSPLPPEVVLRRILRQEGIPLEQVYDLKTEWVLNPSKVDRLISHGFLREELLEGKRVTRQTLRVTLTKEAQSALEEHIVKGEIDVL